MNGDLRDELRDPLHRMKRELVGVGRFRLLIGTFGDARDRDSLIAHIEHDEASAGATISIEPEQGPRWLEAKIARLAADRTRVHVIGFERLGDQREEWFLRLNYGRESISAASPVSVIFWMFEEDADALAKVAPDLWAWRAGVFGFPHGRRRAADLAVLAQAIGALVGESKQRLVEVEQHLAESSEPTATVASLHAEAADLLLASGRLEEALAHADSSLEVSRATGDRRSVGNSYLARGRILLSNRDAAGAYVAFSEAKQLFEAVGDLYGQLQVLPLLAQASVAKGHDSEGLKLLGAALALATKPGLVRMRTLAYLSIARLYLNLAESEKRRGNANEAARYHKRGVHLVSLIDDESERASALMQLGTVEASLGNIERSIDHYRRAAEQFETTGEQRQRALAQLGVALGHLARGDKLHAQQVWTSARKTIAGLMGEGALPAEIQTWLDSMPPQINSGKPSSPS